MRPKPLVTFAQSLGVHAIKGGLRLSEPLREDACETGHYHISLGLMEAAVVCQCAQLSFLMPFPSLLSFLTKRTLNNPLINGPLPSQVSATVTWLAASVTASTAWCRPHQAPRPAPRHSGAASLRTSLSFHLQPP